MNTPNSTKTPGTRAPRTRRSEITSRAQLIEAAQRLIAERPPSAITGKQIAKAAGVHYGLIYHYFESKGALMRVAMEKLAEAYIAHHEVTVDRSKKFPPIKFTGHERWWRAAANFSADGGNSYTSLGWTYPLLTHEIEQIRKHHPDVSEFDAKLHVIREVCQNFGWIFFRETLQTGFKLSESEMARIAESISPD